MPESGQAHITPTHKADASLEETRRELALLRRRVEVEDALEQIRARTMAMQSSDELREVVAVSYEQLEQFGVAAWGSAIYICDAPTDQMEVYFSDITQAVLPDSYTLSRHDHPIFEQVWRTWEEDIPLRTIQLSGEEKRSFDLFYLEQTALRDLPEAVKSAILAEEFVVFSLVSMKHGLLIAFDLQPIADDKAAILQRFVHVFEQAYTRFLDLKRAEAQAREAQIEAALERVRSRTMAMHHSDELLEVVAVVFKEMQHLGFEPSLCSIGIFDVATRGAVWWQSSEVLSVLPQGTDIPYLDHPWYKGIFEAWQQRVPYYVFELSGEMKRSLEAKLFEETDYRNLPEASKEMMQASTRIVTCYALMSHGLIEVVTEEALPDDQAAILQRIARVFEQTYTRFLDLQKAEAQAREAQVEAALERVRARTMAMHHSDELREVVAVVYKQLQLLDFDTLGLGIHLFDKTTGDMESWISWSVKEIHPESYRMPYFKHPYYDGQLNAWREGVPYKTFEFSGALKQSYDRLAFEQSDYQFLDEVKEAILAMDYGVTSNAFMSHGMLEVIGEAPLPDDEAAILQRFARVFEQTYTRFLDLEQAEKQAREAQIEASLERVRARAMAMHQSDELSQVIDAVFKELEVLGFSQSVCAIGIFDATTRGSVWWMSDATRSDLPDRYHVPDLEHPWYASIFDAWQRREPFFVFDLTGGTKKSLDDLLFKETDFKNLPEASIEAMVASERIMMSYASMGHGMLQVVTDEPLSDDKADVVRRFALVIDLTYTRFDDLQQADARAREAVRQASLDRVRAEIASMRTSDDLERITPLVWRELTTLGVPFFRCGVFIIDEAAERIRAYLSTPDGASLAVLNLPFDSAETNRRAVEHWRRQQVYTDHWGRQQFVDWGTSMREQGHIDAVETYQGGDEPPETLSLHFVPFEQGMLYVGSAAPLEEEQVGLVQSLADAFAVAYARYEDFTRLEAAKAEVDAALADLKATQAQLIHSEKMASLGQMAAGIAHEIKNPLNFINNFAEVNEELADELLEALQNGDDLEAIIADLKQNAQVIAQHGRRADGIVRAMMQHASGGKGERRLTAVNELVEEYVGLAFHGKRARHPGFSCEIERNYGTDVGSVSLVPQDVGRVLLNLLSNAFDAVLERAEKAGDAYVPTVHARTRLLDGRVEIRIEDNGGGIPQAVRDRVFEPFFTTKPAGSGTGLGLSLSYDIVTQGHGGNLGVESEEGKGSAFVVTLPQ